MTQFDIMNDAVDEILTATQHQRITEALRGEVSRIESEWKDLYADQMELVQERDQLRAEVERLKAQLAEEIQRRFDGNEISSNEHREEVQRLQAQLAQQQVPDGWKLVPVEPTRDMIAAAPAPAQAEPASPWTKDAEEWGDSLNEAGWVFVDRCPEKSVLLFNNVKPALRAAILKYAELVAGKPLPPAPEAKA